MCIRRDVVQLSLHVGSEKDHTKPYLVIVSCLKLSNVHETKQLTITARWYGQLPSVSGLAWVFAKS